jgi:hypothetical protein
MEVERLQQEKAGLTGEIQQFQAEIEQLPHAGPLATRPCEGRVEHPLRADGGRVAKISNFFDKDNDGKLEKLVVYVQPIDAEGDIRQAAGTVAVQLWKPGQPERRGLAGPMAIEPAELRKALDRRVYDGYRLTSTDRRGWRCSPYR